MNYFDDPRNRIPCDGYDNPELCLENPCAYCNGKGWIYKIDPWTLDPDDGDTDPMDEFEEPDEHS